MQRRWEVWSIARFNGSLNVEIDYSLDIQTPVEKVFGTPKKSKTPSQQVFGCLGTIRFNPSQICV